MIKSKLTYIPFYFLTSIICFIIGVKLISYFNENIFSTYSKLLVGIFLIFFALLILVIYLLIPRIKIYENEIEISSIIGKTRFFSINDITSWFTDKIKSKSGEYEKLYLILNSNSKICLKSYSYSNYIEIKNRLIENKSKNNQLNKIAKIRKMKIVSVVVLTVGIVFILIGLKFINYSVYNENNIQHFQGVLSQDIILKKGRKSHYSVIIKLKNYDNFDFKINTLAIKETFYKDLIKNCHKGDTILLTLSKEEFNKKITLEKDISYYDKLYYFNQVDVLAVEDENYVYLSLKNFNTVQRNNDYWGVGFFEFIGCVFVLIGIKGIIKSRRELKVFENV
jgi:hypothetical protein